MHMPKASINGHTATDMYQNMKNNAHLQNFHARSLLILAFAPLTIYATICFFFTFVYGSSPSLCWICTFVCTCVALLFLALPNKRPDGPMFYVFLGVLCFVATVSGTIAGHWNWSSHMSYDSAYGGQRLYSNVLPTEPALSHLDAGKIVFSSNAQLNIAASMGYKDDGTMYCLAPIMDPAATKAGIVEYFAAGQDCCDAKGTFTCDDYANPKAHAGLVYLQTADKDLLDKFKQASRAYASSDANLGVSMDAIFVKWVQDVEGAAGSYQNAGIFFFLGTTLIYVVASVAAAFAIHLSQKRDAAGGQPMPMDNRDGQWHTN